MSESTKIGDIVIDCGDMTPEEAQKFIAKVKEEYLKKTGRVEKGNS
jgi:polyhydroxyalkanoate synthesis regulator phasin